MERNSTTYWTMRTPLNGSIAALVDSNGDIQEGTQYTAYGEALRLDLSGRLRVSASTAATTRFRSSGAGHVSRPA